MTTHRELAPPDELLKPRDHEPIIAVHPQTWNCRFCDPEGDRSHHATTVEWVGPGTDGPDGRCRECGQKFCLIAGATVPRKPQLLAVTDWHDGAWPYKYRWWARGAT